MLCIVGCKRDDSGCAGSIVVGSSIENLLAKVAEVVIMGSEDITAIVPLSLNLTDDIEALIVLQELGIHIEFDALHAFDGFRSNPDDGLVHDTMAISLEELNRCGPCIDEPCILTFASLLQTGESLAMLVGEPELASHQAILVLGLSKVGKHLVGIEVERIDVIDRELSLDSR